MPIVFVHGIGIGFVFYIFFLLELIKTGRPIFLPEIPEVSAFRPWNFPNSVHSPHHVAASLSTMLASNGFASATFMGHSFGSLWLSYMTKYAPDFVAALVFLDPVCFCLYNSYVSLRGVYSRPDPGDPGYLVRTDMMVSWSKQRNFSWNRGNLFVEEMKNKPCTVFLSGADRVAPSIIQQSYLEGHGAKITEFKKVSTHDFETSNLLVVVFPGDGHGEWARNAFETSPTIVQCAEVMAKKVEDLEQTSCTKRVRTNRFARRFSVEVLAPYME